MSEPDHAALSLAAMNGLVDSDLAPLAQFLRALSASLPAGEGGGVLLAAADMMQGEGMVAGRSIVLHDDATAKALATKSRNLRLGRYIHDRAAQIGLKRAYGEVEDGRTIEGEPLSFGRVSQSAAEKALALWRGKAGLTIEQVSKREQLSMGQHLRIREWFASHSREPGSDPSN